VIVTSFASIPSPTTNVVELGPLDIHVYGVLIALGALLAVWLTRRRFVARGGSPEVAEGAALWALLCGFLGARLAYVSTHLDRFEDRPWAALFIWEGGLALFGGLTAGAIAALVYLKRKNADIGAFADSVAPALPLAQAVGRWGNYFNQELFGTPTNLPWALRIDPEHRVAPYQDFSTFHPTFLYESLYNFALVGFLIWLDRKHVLKRKGSLFGVYAIGYGFARFLLELIRTDTTFRLFGLSRNAYVALAVVLGGSVFLFFYEKRGPRGESSIPRPPEPAPEQSTPHA
jgi:prolipoprotein diacylglyceryl transferase